MSQADQLQKLMRENKLTLSCAESCTGGAIAAAMTKIPSASDYFLGSVVSYSNDMKVDVLGVPEELIEEYGAVSSEVAQAMWQGILAIVESDYAIAVTGIAGPTGGTPKKPVGTVWAAVGRRGEEPALWNVRASGTREEIIEQSIDAVLGKLYELINV